MYEQDLGQIIPDIEATAKVDESTGVPSVTVDVEELVSLDKMIRRFKFMFKNLKGDKPVKGVDYLTEEEKQQFTTETLNLISSEGNKQVKGVTTEGNEQIKKIVAEATKVIEQLKSLVAGNPATTNALTLSGKSRVEFEQDIEKVSNALNELKNNVGANIKDNSIPSSKLKTDSDADKIKLANLAEEVINSMSKLTKDSVVREYIADGAVDISKIDNSIYHTEYEVKKGGSWASITFLVEKKILINANIEVSFFTNYNESDNAPLGIELFNGNTDCKIPFEKVVTKFPNGIFKYRFSSKNVNTTFTRFKIVNNSATNIRLDGKYYDILFSINNKNISFSSLENLDVFSVTNVDYKSVGYDSLLKEVYARQIKLDDLVEKEKFLSTGYTQFEDFETIIEAHKTLAGFKKYVVMFEKKFIPGIYRIKNVYKTEGNYIKLYILDNFSSGEILDVINLNSTNDSFILKREAYIAFQIIEENQAGRYTIGSVGERYFCRFVETDNMFNKGEILNLTSATNITSMFRIEYLKVHSLYNSSLLNELSRKVSYNDNIISTKLISTVPSENLETLAYLDDISKYKFNKIFKTLISSNTLIQGDKIEYTPYQAIDEWKYRVKFKLLEANTILKFKSIDGEYEAGSYIINLATKEIASGEEREVMFLPLVEERIGGEISTYAQSIDINFEVGNYYQIELTRSGLDMKIEIYDFKNDKVYTRNGAWKRLHGGLSFGVDTGSIELKLAHLSTALKSGTKAIFIGDSITEGLSMGTTDISKRWCSLLRDKYFKGNALCSGMGWGTTNNVKQVLDNIEYYCNYIKYYFVMIGTNQRGPNGVATWKIQIVEIYNKIKELGGIPIIIVPPLARADSEYILQMRDFILEKGWDTIRMDIATSTGDGITFDSSLSTDGIHFNVNGNQKMYERALIDLKKIM